MEEERARQGDSSANPKEDVSIESGETHPALKKHSSTIS